MINDKLPYPILGLIFSEVGDSFPVKQVCKRWKAITTEKNYHIFKFLPLIEEWKKNQEIGESTKKN